GTGGGLFSPDQPLTRGQFAKLAVTAFKTPDYSGPLLFDDLIDHWSQPYVMTAYHAGYVEGTSADKFEPDAALSGQAAAVILWRALKLSGVAPSSAASATIDADDWAAESIGQLQKLNIWPLSASGQPLPAKPTMTRAQAAALLDAAIKQQSKMQEPAQQTGATKAEAIAVTSSGVYASKLPDAWFKLQWPAKRTLQLQSRNAEQLRITDNADTAVTLLPDKPIQFTVKAGENYYASGVGTFTVYDGSTLASAYPSFKSEGKIHLLPVELARGQTAYIRLDMYGKKQYRIELTDPNGKSYFATMELVDNAGRSIQKMHSNQLDIPIKQDGPVYLAVTAEADESPFTMIAKELGGIPLEPLPVVPGSQPAYFSSSKLLYISYDTSPNRPTYLLAEHAIDLILVDQTVMAPPPRIEIRSLLQSGPQTKLVNSERISFACERCLVSIFGDGQVDTSIRLLDGRTFESAYEMDVDWQTELPARVLNPQNDPANLYVKVQLRRGTTYKLEAAEREKEPSSPAADAAPQFTIYDASKKQAGSSNGGATTFTPTATGAYYIYLAAGSHPKGYILTIKR
ncbi:MAG: S-layer domain protein, partial [Paenibacillus sp.]|nr:S-layer domain protein [Paenibacillus sp.]